MFFSHRPTFGSIKSDWNSGIFLSQRTPVTCLHFIQTVLIIAQTSKMVSPYEATKDPRYFKWAVVFNSWPLMHIVPSVWGPRSRYSVFAILIVSPFSPSRSYHFCTWASRSSCFESAKATSSAYRSVQGCGLWRLAVHCIHAEDKQQGKKSWPLMDADGDVKAWWRLWCYDIIIELNLHTLLGWHGI